MGVLRPIEERTDRLMRSGVGGPFIFAPRNPWTKETPLSAFESGYYWLKGAVEKTQGRYFWPGGTHLIHLHEDATIRLMPSGKICGSSGMSGFALALWAGPIEEPE